jgi:multisubunit Na+/H+ antiporter MnhC subunit
MKASTEIGIFAIVVFIAGLYVLFTQHDPMGIVFAIVIFVIAVVIKLCEVGKKYLERHGF